SQGFPQPSCPCIFNRRVQLKVFVHLRHESASALNPAQQSASSSIEPSANSALADELSVIVELLHVDAQPPKRATSGSAGYDLCAYLRGRSVKCSDGQRIW